MKSRTPECAQIEQFATTVPPSKTRPLCLQDLDSRDYTLEIHVRPITIAKEQYEDGTWQEIVRRALLGNAEVKHR